MKVRGEGELNFQVCENFGKTSVSSRISDSRSIRTSRENLYTKTYSLTLTTREPFEISRLPSYFTREHVKSFKYVCSFLVLGD